MTTHQLSPVERRQLRRLIANSVIEMDDESGAFFVVATAPDDSMRQCNVRLPHDLLEDMEEVCGIIQVPQSEFIRAAIRNQVDAQRRVLREKEGA